MNIQNLNLGLPGELEALAKQQLIAELDDDTTDLDNQDHDEEMYRADEYFEREPQW